MTGPIQKITRGRGKTPLYDDIVGFEEYAKQRELSKKENLSQKQAPVVSWWITA